MIPLLSAEILKLRTNRALWLGAGVLLAFAVYGAQAELSRLADPSSDLDGLRPDELTEALRHSVPQVAAAFGLLIGMMAGTGEFRHRTIVTTLLACADRSRVLTAKLLVVIAAGAAFGLLAGLAGTAAMMPVLRSHDVDLDLGQPGLLPLLLVIPLLTAMCAVIGGSVGWLLRNPATAVGALMGWAAIVETLLLQLTVKWLPVAATLGLLRVGTSPRDGFLAPDTAAIALLAITAVLAGAALLDPRREV